MADYDRHDKEKRTALEKWAEVPITQADTIPPTAV